MSDERVEAMARFLCRRDGIDPDEEYLPSMSVRQRLTRWKLHITEARAALAVADGATTKGSPQ